MKKRSALRLLTALSLIMTLMYTAGMMLVLALLSDFEIDGWFWVAVIVVYLVTLPIFISLFSIIQLFHTKLKYSIIPSRKMKKARTCSFWMAVGSVISVIAVILFSFFSFNYGGFILIFSYLLSIASIVTVSIDSMLSRKKQKALDNTKLT